MIEAIAFCPQAPVVVPDLAAGAAAELAELRTACTATITQVAAGGRQIVLLGAANASAYYPASSRGSLAAFGVPLEVQLGEPTGAGEPDLPPALTVGAWLVEAALGPGSGTVGIAVGPDFATSRAAADLRELVDAREIALVVAADGTARRSLTAPGYLDERAASYDDAIVQALRTGDAAALGHLDPDVGEQLLAAGVPAWRAVANLAAGQSWTAEMLYVDDPYGVAYLVAAWTRRA
ncbi:MAG: hypothetical protein JWP39_688 [Jatrophihabitans sp.]|nr:hypothetical protein [Jatrophihabitans sp.]